MKIINLRTVRHKEINLPQSIHDSTDNSLNKRFSKTVNRQPLYNESGTWTRKNKEVWESRERCRLLSL